MYSIEVLVIRKDQDSGQVVDSRQVFIRDQSLHAAQLVVKLLYDLATSLRRLSGRRRLFGTRTKIDEGN